MAKMRRKADLPQKPCLACGRAFAWRRKWRNVWDEVKFCSERCREAGVPCRLVADADPRGVPTPIGIAGR